MKSVSFGCKIISFFVRSTLARCFFDSYTHGNFRLKILGKMLKICQNLE